ncbi:MAG: orotate phosphoribosyltransferase [Clostridiales bacterium]|nr:orotate phosphoribosyltransferase [Clostridiales bacterium]
MGYKREFIDFMLEAGVLSFGDFITKSGRKSPYFINTGNYKKGSHALKLGRFYAECIMENIRSGKIPEDISVLFGPAYKGIPLSVATTIVFANDYGKDLNYCFNRKEVKDHGEGGSMVGYKLSDGDKLLIIEDVITAGTAVRECIPILKAAADVEICGLVVSVDRMEKGKGSLSAKQELYEEFGIPTFSIVNIVEILEILKDTLDDNIKKRMEDYMENYCVL